MDKCVNSFVPKYIKRNSKISAEKTKKILSDINAKLRVHKDPALLRKQKLHETLLRNTMKRPDKQQIRAHINMFCNPQCVGTAFQTIPYTNEDLDKMYNWAGNNKQSLIAEMTRANKKYRKNMKNGFYNKINAKTRKQLMKEGALSGCVVGL